MGRSESLRFKIRNWRPLRESVPRTLWDPFPRRTEELHMKRMVQATNWSTTWHEMMSLEHFGTLEKSSVHASRRSSTSAVSVYTKISKEEAARRGIRILRIRWIDVNKWRLHQRRTTAVVSWPWNSTRRRWTGFSPPRLSMEALKMLISCAATKQGEVMEEEEEEEEEGK